MRARCLVCRADLETRPVLRSVRRAAGPEGATFKKRVHMKPAQVVIACRCEGSFNAENLPDTAKWELRVCVDCLKGRTFAEVIAVALDRALEAGQ